ncbi:MAG: flagellin [Vicinamibacterales bacterium]|nr:flagellin [Vicinamibacterales bacterium]
MASFSVVSNISSSVAQSHLVQTNSNLNQTLTRLSSGFRINQSGDDAAGLAVANTYRNSIAVLNQGIRNANDGLSDLQIKDGAANNISTLLDRLSTLATQAASGSTSDASRQTLNQEFQDILAEIQRESNVASLATASGFSIFIQNTTTAADGKISGTISAVTTTTLTLNGHVITSQALAQSAVVAVASAVTVLGQTQGTLGTLQNRLQFAISLAQTQVVNNKAAESRIRDANIAEESANLTRYNILTQSGVAALAQANQTSSSVLTLLRG